MVPIDTSHEMDCPLEPRHFQPIRTVCRGRMEAFGGSLRYLEFTAGSFHIG